MTVAYCSDVHLGNHRQFGGPVERSLNRRCRQALDVFRRAAELAAARRCTHFVVAGDLFDYHRPEAPLIAAVQEVLSKCRDAGTLPVLLVGNHELISSTRGDHALSPLVGYALVVEGPEMHNFAGVRVLMVPYLGAGTADKLMEAVRIKTPEVLVVHAGIADEQTPPWLRGADDAISVERLMSAFGMRWGHLVIAGNWHNARNWEFDAGRTSIVQLGALVPTGFDNPGLDGYGRLVFAGGGSYQQQWLPGPRFLVVRGKEELDVLVERRGENLLYVRWDCAPDGEREAAAWLAYLQSQGKIVEGRTAPQVEEAALACAAAAAQANERQGLAAALEAYVGGLPDLAPEDRPAVLGACRRYLRLD